MRPSRRITVVASCLLVSCLAGSVLLLRKVDRQRTGAGAVANAVWHATGIRVRRFPIRLDDLMMPASHG